MQVWRVPAVVCGLVLLAIVGLAAPAGAQGIQLGPFRLLPSLGLSLEYDDNILLTPDDEIDDFIWHITPGITIELPSRRYAIRLGYQADILRYMDNTDLDTVHHQALADARVDFAFGVGLRLTDRFLITDDVRGLPGARADRAGGAMREHARRRRRVHLARAVHVRRELPLVHGGLPGRSGVRSVRPRRLHRDRGRSSIESSRRHRCSGRSSTSWSATTSRRSPWTAIRMPGGSRSASRATSPRRRRP